MKYLFHQFRSSYHLFILKEYFSDEFPTDALTQVIISNCELH